jgi:peptidoglycan/LPS O-acetylase OafA/YrhL
VRFAEPMWLIAANLAFLALAAVLCWMAQQWLLRSPRDPGRALERRACALTSVLILAGFPLAQVGMNESWTGRAHLIGHAWALFGLGLVAALWSAHALLRLQGSRADQMLMPVAAFLSAIGLVGLYVWETRDDNAYVSTVAVPALERYRAAIEADPALAP